MTHRIEKTWRAGRRRLGAVALVLALVVVPGRAALGYVEAAYSLGRLVAESTNVVVLRVEQVDKTKNLIVFSKVRDVKGTHKGETVKHNIGKGGFHPREWQNVMTWAEVGKTALFFHNGGASETCIDGYWYQAYAGEWWQLSHAEPYLLRTFAGKPDKLATAVGQMLAGQEVVVPCMMDGDKNALQLRTARLLRMKASLKILDHDQKRDFAGWGVEEFRTIAGMPGFTHYAALDRVGPGAAGIASADLDGDGKPDVCLVGAGRVVLLQNGGNSLNEVPLGLPGGARAAAWADYNRDDKVDLLLATPFGPKLFTNEGGTLKDTTGILPQQPYYNLTAAAWIDADGDSWPDILLADGFRGLRLYRNRGEGAAHAAKSGLGSWYVAGPFDNPGGKGFDTVYPPEQGVDLAKQYVGRGNAKVVWKEGKFTDGQVNNLALFGPEHNENAVAYLYRELNLGGECELPVSMGSDDTLTVWLNGEKLVAQNTPRSCAPDQAVLKLKLKPGKNVLLLKVCQTSGQFAFYFAAKEPAAAVAQGFDDVSDQVGLGERGVAGGLKGDHLATADVDGDGRYDFLYSAGTGVLVRNTPKGFVAAKDSGISYRCGRVAPAFGDFNGDGRPDLFVPQQGRCLLLRNDGKGRFTDVTAGSGALAEAVGRATCAVWTDFGNRGRLDLVVGCLKGPNRYFRGNGDGTFADATEEIGLYQRIFNTCGLSAIDMNKDGVLDLVLNNEGQESAVLLGNPARISSGASRRQ